MKASIFIKTWKNDLRWLHYCLKSIERYGSGFEDVVVVTDSDCLDETIEIAKTARVESAEKWPNGYIHQQWVKLNVDSYVNTELVLFVDSDCIFFREFSPESFIQDGRPILLKTRYTELGADPVSVVALKWKQITQAYVRWNVEWEYMRKMPMMFHVDSVTAVRKFVPYFERRLRKIEKHEFSEFNVIGAYVDRKEQSRYFVTDTQVWCPESVAEHFWSWSGITDEERRRIHEHIKEDVP